MPEGPVRATKKLTTSYLSPELENWLHQVFAEAVAERADVSKSDIMRFALAELAQRGGWADLREGLLAFTAGKRRR